MLFCILVLLGITVETEGAFCCNFAFRRALLLLFVTIGTAVVRGELRVLVTVTCGRVDLVGLGCLILLFGMLFGMLFGFAMLFGILLIFAILPKFNRVLLLLDNSTTTTTTTTTQRAGLRDQTVTRTEQRCTTA